MLSPYKAVRPGSFDLIHLGHLEQAYEDLTIPSGQKGDTIKQVTLLISGNPSKNKANFYVPEKKSVIHNALHSLPEDIRNNISVDSYTGLIVDYCQKYGIKYICKSARNKIDMMEEEAQSHYNSLIDAGVETIIRCNPSDQPERNSISSSAERTMIGIGAKGVSPHSTPMAAHLMDIRLRDQYIIGMVGEMGSGKSFHGEMYAKLGEAYGIPTHNIDMDSFIGTIYKAGPAFAHVREDVVSLFGDDVLNPDGSINVDVLRPLVFSQPDKKEKLNIIMRPAMATVLRDTLADKKGLIIINAALLPDHDRGSLTNNNVIAVDVTPEIQKSRIIYRSEKKGRGTPSDEAIQNMLSSQLPIKDKIAYYEQKQSKEHRGKTLTIDNSDTIDLTHGIPDSVKQSFREAIDIVDQDLSLRFSALCTRLGLQGDHKALFHIIYARYISNNLFHHTWEHIKDGIRMIDKYRDHFEDPDAAMMAYFLHDGIYSTQKNRWGKNEDESAELMRTLCTDYKMLEARMLTAYNIIRATKHEGKNPAYYTNDQKLIMDIDVSILAASPERYHQYAIDIRAEYSQYSDKDFNAGRIAVLEKLLEKPLFYTELFAEKNEIAKANMRGEIARLRAMQ